MWLVLRCRSLSSEEFLKIYKTMKVIYSKMRMKKKAGAGELGEMNVWMCLAHGKGK